MTQRVVTYTYGTGNPVLPDGSIDVRDGIDNLQSLDIFTNAQEDTYNQRDGNIVRTVAGMNNAFDAQILNMGFTRVGTFSSGATLTNPRQTLLWGIADGGDGQEYGWSGAFPKVVPANSTPDSTGGIADGAWMSRFDPELRIQVRESLRQIYAGIGFNLVAGSFESGGVLVNPNDVLLHEASGKAFSGPAGTVTAGTNPNAVVFVDRSGVFNQRIVWASLVGILPTNTPEQNTAALNAVRSVGGVSLYFPAGAYPFDVFPTTGLAEVSGAGKDTVTIELHGTTSPVMVQPGPIVHKGIWFKSVAGSLEWSRIGMSNYAVFDKCKITGFTNTSPLPNAWGIYLDKVTGCRLYYCELDGNSQSDIAIVEGVTDFMAVGCYSANGTLNINIETNVNTPAIGGIVLQGMNIKTLQLLCNALSGDAPDKAVTVLGCSVNTLIYDGIGASFIESQIKNYAMQLDNLKRAYGANITGIRVSARELLPDPMFSSVGDTGRWKTQFSSAIPANRYNRGVENQLVIGVNGVAAQTIVTSGNIPCAPETPYLVTIAKEYIQYAGRNDIISVQFKNSSGVVIGSAISLVKPCAQFRPDTQQHIVVSPTNAAFIELWLSGSDSTVDYQSTQYSYASVRQILASGGGVDSSCVGFSQFPKRVMIGDTASNFFSFNHYFCPLPVGTEVEFAYAAGGARLSQVTAAATDATGNLGTLRVIANYP